MPRMSPSLGNDDPLDTRLRFIASIAVIEDADFEACRPIAMLATQSVLQIVDERIRGNAVIPLKETSSVFRAPAAVACDDNDLVGCDVEQPEQPVPRLVGRFGFWRLAH